MADKPATVDAYIAAFPDDVRPILQRTRETLLAAIPGSTEKIRYGMPAVMFGEKYAVHFGGWKKHLGLYPVPAATGDFEAELAQFRRTRSTVVFVYAKPIPYELIARIGAYLVETRLGADAAE